MYTLLYINVVSLITHITWRLFLPNQYFYCFDGARTDIYVCYNWSRQFEFPAMSKMS